MKKKNPIAKAVTRIRQKIIPNKKRNANRKLCRKGANEANMPSEHGKTTLVG